MIKGDDLWLNRDWNRIGYPGAGGTSRFASLCSVVTTDSNTGFSGSCYSGTMIG